MKKSFGTTVILISFSLFLASVGLSAPDYKGPAMADLAEPAQKAIKEQLGDGKLVRIEEFIKDDQAYYRVELTKEGKERSFTVDDEGKLCQLQVSLEEAPDPVQAGIRQQVGDGKLVQIDKVSGEEGTTYEVEITKGGRDREFTVNANGELTRVEFFLEETPASVQKAIRTRLGSGRLGEIHRLLDKGQTTYRAEMTRHRKAMPFTVSSAGKLISAVVGLEETPPAVQRTIRRQVGDGYLDEVQWTIDEDEVTYDVTFTKADESKDFTVLANGRLDRGGK
jgi:uncharacterized membrane protein YkoI